MRDDNVNDGHDFSLSAQEQQMLKIYQNAGFSKKEKPFVAARKNRVATLLRNPLFYAVVIFVLGFVVSISLSLFVVGVSQVSDVDALIQLAQEDATHNIAQGTGVSTSWLDFIVWLEQNLIGAIVSVFVLFSVISAMLVLFSSTIKKAKKNTNTD